MTTSFAGFARQLQGQPGVQLNPLVDQSERPDAGFSDQNMACAIRAKRGPIHRAFPVTAGTFLRRLGKADTIRKNALNEGMVHVFEAVNNGVQTCVVSRLVPASAKIKYAVAYIGTGAELAASVSGGEVSGVSVTAGGTGFMPDSAVTLSFYGSGTGATATATVNSAGEISAISITSGGAGYAAPPTVSFASVQYRVEDSEPVSGFFVSLKHLECFNDGIKIEIHADVKRENGALVANDEISLVLRDHENGTIFTASGSLDPDAKDDFGKSNYLGDIIARLAPDILEAVFDTPSAIPVDSAAYGYDAAGRIKWAKSSVLVCFDEGGTAYLLGDYIRSRLQLTNTRFGYDYISATGSQSTALLTQLGQLSYNTNRQLRFSAPGWMTPEQAIIFIEQMNFPSSETAHLIHAFWCPVKSDDPLGVNPPGFFGTESLNIAYACRRNAVLDANGLARKNYAIAGRNFPVNRTGLSQTITLDPGKESAIANAKINPVVFSTFSGGQLCVFIDSLTQAPVVNSLRKLISVADMASAIDNLVVRISNDNLQLPMDDCIGRTTRDVRNLLERAASSKWLIPSAELEGNSFALDVRPNAARPFDTMDVRYWCSYDRTARVIMVQQTLSRFSQGG